MGVTTHMVIERKLLIISLKMVKNFDKPLFTVQKLLQSINIHGETMKLFIHIKQKNITEKNLFKLS